jgi:hypothetical protein
MVIAEAGRQLWYGPVHIRGRNCDLKTSGVDVIDKKRLLDEKHRSIPSQA